MAATDPRTTIRNILVAYIAANPITEDDGITASSVGILWEGGPESLLYLFYTVNYDVLITLGDPRSRSVRRVEDEPTHYLMSYPVTVTTMDKFTAGVLSATAARMQYKTTYAIRHAIEGSARSAPAATPAYRLHVITDDAKYKRSGYVYVWEAVHRVEYETGYP
jgi:hypothetical protein